MGKWFDAFGTIATQFQIGIGGTGIRRLRFRNGSNGDLEWNPTGGRVITLPDGSGTVFLAEDAVDTGNSANKLIKTNSIGVLDPTFLPYVGARVYHSVDQSIAHNANSPLSFNSEKLDGDNIHSTVTNNSHLTVNTGGTYIIGGTFLMAANATGVRQISIRLNGSTLIAAERIPAHAAESMLTISTVYNLAAGSYLQLLAYQNSGVALNVIAAANYSPEFFMQLVAQ